MIGQKTLNPCYNVSECSLCQTIQKRENKKGKQREKQKKDEGQRLEW